MILWRPHPKFQPRSRGFTRGHAKQGHGPSFQAICRKMLAQFLCDKNGEMIGIEHERMSLRKWAIKKKIKANFQHVSVLEYWTIKTDQLSGIKMALILVSLPDTSQVLGGLFRHHLNFIWVGTVAKRHYTCRALNLLLVEWWNKRTTDKFHSRDTTSQLLLC